MKKLLLPLFCGLSLLLAGCASEVVVGPVPPPIDEPIVYYGWYGSYYGYYYWNGPVVVFGCPPYGWHGWRGHYHHYDGGTRYYHHTQPVVPPRNNFRAPAPAPSPRGPAPAPRTPAPAPRVAPSRPSPNAR